MKIRLAKTAGFCMGVRRAVDIVLDVANSGTSPIYTFGPLIHNPQVLEILSKKGVMILDDPLGAKKGTVVIRAHGVPPQTREFLANSGLKVIDATCPRVIKVQTIIAKHAQRGCYIVIVGDADHPEVVGLIGHAEGRGYVVSGPDEVTALPDLDRLIVVAQTTQDGRLFEAAAREAKARFPGAKVYDTMCDSTHRRQADVREMAKTVDAVIVVGGRDSGNTKRLAQIVEQQGVAAFHIESEAEIDCAALENLKTVGITAGASTPNWVIRKAYRTLEALPYRSKPYRRWLFKVQYLLMLSDAYLALGAGCLSYACALLAGIGPSLTSAAMASCYALSMYILNHLIGQEAVQYNNPDKAQLFKRHRTLFLVTALVSGAVGLLLALALGMTAFAVLFFSSAFGVLYKLRLLPRGLAIGGRIVRISDIPGSKTILIAAAWAIVTVILPNLAQPTRHITAIFVAAIFASSMVFVMTAFFDVLSMQGDRIVGQESLPLVLGERKSIHMLKIVLATCLGTLVVGKMTGAATTCAYALVPSVIYVGAILYAFERRNMVPGFRLEFLVESVFALAAALSLIWTFL